MTTTMTTSEERDRDELKLVVGIAEKLWWGWIPLTGQRKWQEPTFSLKGKKVTHPMTMEEREWFKRH